MAMAVKCSNVSIMLDPSYHIPEVPISFSGKFLNIPAPNRNMSEHSSKLEYSDSLN